MLPGEIVTAVKSWERRSGAKVYVMALWSNSEGSQTAFESVAHGPFCSILTLLQVLHQRTAERF